MSFSLLLKAFLFSSVCKVDKLCLKTVIDILPIAMDPSEVEFLAEKELVQIVPNFSQDRIYLIGGDFGPFIPSMPTAVPLWLAVDLKVLLLPIKAALAVGKKS